MNFRVLFGWLGVLLGAIVFPRGTLAASADGYLLDFPDLPPPVFASLPPPTNGLSVTTSNAPSGYYNLTSVASVSGGNSAVPTNPSGFPSDGTASKPATLMLVQSGFGYVTSGDKPDLYLGDLIPIPTPPDGYTTNNIDWNSIIWTSGNVSNGTIVFLEPSVPGLYTGEGGAVTVTWAFTNATGNSSQSNVYTVAGVPRSRPHRIFYTEPPYNAPTVNLAGRHVKFRYNTSIHEPTSLITTNYTYQSDLKTVITATPAATNLVGGLWLDSSGQLHADPGTNGMHGLVVMQYFQTGALTNQIHSSNGVIVVEVAAPQINTIPVGVGEELTPTDKGYGKDGLEARITAGLGASPYVYQFKGQSTANPKDGSVFALRDTTQAPWNIEIYWEEADPMGTRWPYELDWYQASWSSSEAQVYVVGPANAPGTPAYLPSSLGPQILPEQDPVGHAQLSSDGAFTATLPDGSASGYSLLRFSGTDSQGYDSVWFQVIQTVMYTNAPGADRTPIPWPIGTEIVPTSNAYALSFDGIGDALKDVALAGSGFSTADFSITASVRVQQPDDGLSKPVFALSCADCGPPSWEVELVVNSEGVLTPKLAVAAAPIGTVPAVLLKPAGPPHLVLRDSEWETIGIRVSGTNLTVTCGGISRVFPMVMALSSQVGGGNAPTLTFGTDTLAHDWFRGQMSSLSVESPSGTALLDFTVGTNSIRITNDAGSTVTNLVDASGNYLGSLSGTPQIVAYSAPTQALLLPNLSAVHDYIYDPAGTGPYHPGLYQVASPRNAEPESYVYGVNSGLIEVWWLQALAQAGMTTNVYFPALPVVYTNVWPRDVPQIVLSSGQGSPPLEVLEPPVVYVQNTNGLPGYNPNEEHALMGETEDGWVAYALRDDLGTTATSEPYVLAQFTNPTNGLPGMQAYHVVRTNAAFPGFNYLVTVPGSLNGPHPLDLLPPVAPTTSISGPTAWRDRELDWWAVGAGAGTNYTDSDYLRNKAVIQMRPYYPMQPGFWFPSLATKGLPQPNNGAPIAWLPTSPDPDNTAQAIVPITTSWTASWPTNAPTMQVGQTLTTGVGDLPDLWNQPSVQVVHQQVGKTGWSDQFVTLFDPVGARSTALANLLSIFQTGPMDQAGYVYDREGLFYFRGLAPDLSERLYWDPTQQELTLVGALHDEVDPPYLLINTLTQAQKDEITQLSSDPRWTTAVAQLPTTVTNIVPDVPYNNAALTAVGTGAGLVTLAFNNGNYVEPGSPITLQVIQVANTLFIGSVLPLEDPVNMLSEQINLLYSETFAGQEQAFDFDWRSSPPFPGGMAPTNASTIQVYTNGNGVTRLLIGGAGAKLSEMDNQFFAVRYRARNSSVQAVVGTNWSAYTPFNLAEGWVQRVLNALTPFEQRLRDLSENPVETQGSMVQQAGPPYTGDVALTLGALDSVGLIELYSTVMSRAKKLSILGDDPVNDFGVNGQLILAASRLHALYMVLGNEAYADAMDPTIGFGSQPYFVSGGLPSVDYGALSSSLFSFANQVPSLLDEELALLRGRGNEALAPGMGTDPFFNRLFWNFTKGIDAGEVAYAVNYNTHQATNGLITAAAAKALYPQGHGDAWGHYLSALRGYLDLLANSHFEWGVPAATPMLLDPQTELFAVDAAYRDEERIAETAAVLTRTGVEIVRRAARKAYTAGPPSLTPLYPGSGDDDPQRAWGVGEWAGRAGSLSLYNWALGQSLVASATWTNAIAEGLPDSNRNTVRQLDEVVAGYRVLQQEVDDLDQGLNPLGISAGTVPFDISPTAVDAGQTHFEQIYQRALVALQNAGAAFDAAQNAGRLLRQQSESALRFDETLADQESSFYSQLVQIYGYPYAEDIGPNATYPQGYNGPDLYHYQYVDLAALGFDPRTEMGSKLTVTNYQVSTELLQDGGAAASVPLDTSRTISFHFAANGLMQAPSGWTTRRAEGDLQGAYRNYLASMLAYQTALQTWINDADRTSAAYDWYHSGDAEAEGWYEMQHGQLDSGIAVTATTGAIATAEQAVNFLAPVIEGSKDAVELAFSVLRDSLPRTAIAGTADGGDLTSFGRAAALAGEIAGKAVLKVALSTKDTYLAALTAASTLAQMDQTLKSLKNDFAVADHGMRSAILENHRALQVSAAGVFSAAAAMEVAQQRFLTLTADGEELQAELSRIRTAAANRIAMGRYNDMAFRIFRNDALRRYGDAFELAARYTYLAAKAYDYETCLLPSEKDHAPGSLFLEQVIRARTVGRLNNGQPVVGAGVGDPGLADILARMNGNWQVLQGRLGFNNPDTETSYFSLRQELFRIPLSEQHDEAWSVKLGTYWVDDLRTHPVFRKHCLPFASESGLEAKEPGLVIPFRTAIQFGRNFFDQPLAGGDGAYDSSHFATKIRGVGVWFSNYDEVVQGFPDAQLAQQPRVYLIPTGQDRMRSPTGDGSTVRSWQVVDQAIPVPYPVGAELNSRDWIPIQDSLSGPWAQARKHAALRAYHDHGFTLDELTYNSRLVGRSVWNDQWYLIVPAGSLGANREAALTAFIRGRQGQKSPSGVVEKPNGVSDIKLYFQTYSYHGN